jgi:hypothetical protein
VGLESSSLETSKIKDDLSRFPFSELVKVLIQRPDIYRMEECKIPVWGRDKMFRLQRGAAFFQRRASFWLAFVTV